MNFKKTLSSKNKKKIDKLEKRLIQYFGDRLENDQIGGGEMSDTGEYSIYIVHK